MAEHGLYVDSLIYEIEYQDIKFDENYRKQLEEKADKECLYFWKILSVGRIEIESKDSWKKV